MSGINHPRRIIDHAEVLLGHRLRMWSSLPVGDVVSALRSAFAAEPAPRDEPPIDDLLRAAERAGLIRGIER